MNSLCKQESVKGSPFYPPVMRVTEQHSTVGCQWRRWSRGRRGIEKLKEM